MEKASGREEGSLNPRGSASKKQREQGRGQHWVGGGEDLHPMEKLLLSAKQFSMHLTDKQPPHHRGPPLTATYIHIGQEAGQSSNQEATDAVARVLGGR